MFFRQMAATEAPYCLHETNCGDARFAFLPLADAERLDVGDVSVEVLHAPGHAPDSVCLLVTDLRRGDAPWFVIKDDTLFVGAVGRPDEERWNPLLSKPRDAFVDALRDAPLTPAGMERMLRINRGLAA